MLKALVAGLALTVPAIASAEVITQTDSNLFDNGAFYGFDSSLGALQSVTLTISDSEHRFGSFPEGQSIDWSTNGLANFYFYLNGSLLDIFQVPISGSGTINDENSIMQVSGSASFNIAPGLIPEEWVNGERNTHTYIQFMGPGFYDLSDTTFSGGPVNSSWCSSLSCTYQSYTLTYTYRPFNNHAVPEPATWAMMLIGFGITGFALRRRKASPKSPPSANDRNCKCGLHLLRLSLRAF